LSETSPVQAVKVYRGNRDIAPLILNVDARWTSMVKITPRPPYPLAKEPGTHWIGRWVGTRAGVSVLGKTKISCFCRITNPGSSSP